MDFAHPRWLLSPMVSDQSRPDHRVLGIDDPVKLPPQKRKPRVALLLHGIACTWRFMKQLGEDLTQLRTEKRRKVYNSVYYVAFDWRRPIEENGAALRKLLLCLADQVSCVDLYGYSSGGLICRAAIELAPAVHLPVRSLFTLHTPHRGSSLAYLIHTGIPGLGAYVNLNTDRWSSPGVKDLVPNSAVLKKLWTASPAVGVQTVMVGGDGGSRLFGGLTRVAFLLRSNDGVVSVNSQLDQVGSGPDRHPQARRLLFPGHHFSIAEGLNGLGNDPDEIHGPVEVFLDVLLEPAMS